MPWIKSKVIPNAIWEINHEVLWKSVGGRKTRALKHSSEIVAAEVKFIENYDPVIYCNDRTGQNWCYDTMLPTGGWLENITVSWKNGKQVFKALILC